MRLYRIIPAVAGMILITGSVACGSGTPAAGQTPTVAATTAAPVATGPRPADCGAVGSWGLVAKSDPKTTTHKVVGVRVSPDRQAVCFDYALFILDGKDTFAGFGVEYVNDTTLKVTVRAPSSGSITLPSAADLSKMKVIKQVTMASSTAGETVFTIEVTAKLPFLADVQLDGASGSAVVVKIALQ